MLRVGLVVKLLRLSLEHDAVLLHLALCRLNLRIDLAQRSIDVNGSGGGRLLLRE